jgi:CubicO group peptidase (beta-lactamase class C family)
VTPVPGPGRDARASATATATCGRPALGPGCLTPAESVISAFEDHYAFEPGFVAAIAADPSTHFSAARLVSYAVGVPLGPAGWAYSDTNYILAQMIIERATRRSYAEQLTSRIIRPLGLRAMCYAPHTCPAADVARIPTGYFYMPGAPSLLGKPMPRLALTWAQGAGGIVSSLRDMTTWDRALYQGRELPPRLRTRRLPDHHPVDGNGLVLRRRDTRLPGRALLLPRSGIIIALSTNSATDQTLQKAA